MQTIIPNLWFDTQAEEAANFYISVFKDGKITDITHYGKSGAEVSGQPEGSVLTVTFQLRGQEFVGLNGGPQFKFSDAVSFAVMCEDQEEVDYFWEKLGEGGQPGPCGWLKDKYGVSWQIVPKVLEKLVRDPDQAKAERVMMAMLKMGKIEIDGLTKAAGQ
jgi:predicted 3-demethylubiquinone-9 3-methyltransferase (glyoxalase superfamily)